MNDNKKLIDTYERRLNYLRISITDKCNLRCMYCMPDNGACKLAHEDMLTYEELLRLAKIAVSLGIDKIRLTGGEPLVRKGIYEFIPKLSSIPGLKDLSLTTNGIFLKDNAVRLKSSGVKRINISLDTLHRDKYTQITGFDGFHLVWDGINIARKLEFDPIKINVVAIDGLNEDELVDFAKLTLDNPYKIRFIEYMPIGNPGMDSRYKHIPRAAILSKLDSLGKLIRIPKSSADGPSERFKFKNASGEIGFISPWTHHFCNVCNRLRLTSNGFLRPCLLSDQEEDVKGPMRNGATDKELADIFIKTASIKPQAHKLNTENHIACLGQMSAIGG